MSDKFSAFHGCLLESTTFVGWITNGLALCSGGVAQRIVAIQDQFVQYISNMRWFISAAAQRFIELLLEHDQELTREEVAFFKRKAQLKTVGLSMYGGAGGI
jgi:hypothetical protein